MKKAFVPSRGRFLRVKDVPRGPPVLRTSEQWHQRALSIRWDNWHLYMLFFGVSIYAIYLGLGWALGMPLAIAFMNATIYLVTYVSLIYLMETYQSNREVVRQTHSGLFTYGIQARHVGTHLFFFVPYIDIIDFRVKQGWFFQTLVLDIRCLKRPFKIEYMPELLGADGLAELRRRIDGTMEIPKMMIYGDRRPVELPVNALTIRESRVPVYSTRIQF